MEHTYKSFVQSIIMCLQPIITAENGLAHFCEGSGNPGGCCQEYACLCGDQAKLFVWLLRDRAEQTGLDRDLFRVEYSRVALLHGFPTGRCTHSCYPKNIKRWLTGTLSRKKRCRAEFVALAACWAAGWSADLIQAPPYSSIMQELLERLTSGQDTLPKDIRALFDLLWLSSEQAYRNSLSEKRVRPV